jgi:hypothetical protein
LLSARLCPQFSQKAAESSSLGVCQGLALEPQTKDPFLRRRKLSPGDNLFEADAIQSRLELSGGPWAAQR